MLLFHVKIPRVSSGLAVRSPFGSPTAPLSEVLDYLAKPVGPVLPIQLDRFLRFVRPAVLDAIHDGQMFVDGNVQPVNDRAGV
jgi:hypothetical protein